MHFHQYRGIGELLFTVTKSVATCFSCNSMPLTIKITCGTLDKLIRISWILDFVGAPISFNLHSELGACEEEDDHDGQFGSRCLESIN